MVQSHPARPLRPSIILLGLLPLFVLLVPVIPAVPGLIVDTDIGGGGCMDVDDVGALCVAHALADAGEVDFLGVVVNTSPARCAGVVSVINHYYGRDGLPIGAYKGADLSPTAPFLPYVAELTSGRWNFSRGVRNASQVPSATGVYRRALAGAEDHSVVISSIGLLTNLRALLESRADAISPLAGPALVALKVKQLFVMGGKYPSSADAAPECNLCGCAWAGKRDADTSSAAAHWVVAHWPPSVRLVFSGFNIGVKVQSGGTPLSNMPADNPCRAAYVNYEGGPGKSRFSWDPLNTLAAVRGATAAHCSECYNCSGGVNTVDAATGANAWVAGSASNSSYLVLDDAVKAGAALDALLVRPPQREGGRAEGAGGSRVSR